MELRHHRVVIDRPDGRRRRRARPVGCSVLVVTALLLAGSAVPAAADTGGSATGYVQLPQDGLRSISANPPGFDYDSCYGIDGGQAQATVEIPNGICQGPYPNNASEPITIVNGAASADILVEATEFDPSDGSTPWTLCVPDGPGTPPGPLCDASGGGGYFPGTDQAWLQLTNAPGGYWDYHGDQTTVSTTPSCDEAFDLFVLGQAGACVAAGGQTQEETPFFRAPQSSTDQSPVFSNTITWIAAPPGS